MEGHEHIKQHFKYIYVLAKNLEDQTSKSTSFDDIFALEILQKRKKLRHKCVQLIFLDHENYGKKAREILWRQGCYNAISKVKKQKSKLAKHEICEIRSFLFEVINLFKLIASKTEKLFQLDLKHLINLSLIENIEPCEDEQIIENLEFGIQISLESIDYAIKTIHFLLISLGDSHRYLNDFKVIESGGNNHGSTTFEMAANFYQEAFKLNSTIGMAQNQLGTLYENRNYDLNSIFHYLFSLQCKFPFLSSEDNLLKIFHKNIEYIEKSEGLQSTDSLKDFLTKFILIIDIFFYDKNIIDLNNLCHYNFIEFKRNIQQLNNENLLFKFVTIILFTIRNLKNRHSTKLSNLNALLLAITSEIIDLCLAKIENFIKMKDDANKMFSIRYDKFYELYDKMVVDSKHKTRNRRIKSVITPVSSEDNEQENANSENGINSDQAKNLDNKKKIAIKYRRRRKRINIRRSSSEDSENSSCDEMISDFESDNDEVELNEFSDDSELSEDSFSSDDENEDENNKDSVIVPNGIINYKDYNSDDDVVIEDEVLVICDKDEDDIIIVEEKLSYENTEIDNDLVQPLNDKLKYLPKYSKIDPSIILNFAKTDETLKTLKILFDWLRNNNDILVNCYQTNPEFIHKLIKLVNYLNIDIFTRKVYFNFNLLKFDKIRSDNLISLFDQRQAIPLQEDVILKGFDLFESNQAVLDWETTSRMEITSNEETLIRVLKLVDFGFYITKLNKFNYVFCKKTRNFIEGESKRRRRFLNSRQKKYQRNGGGGGGGGIGNGYLKKKNGFYRKYRNDSNQPKDEAIISNGKTILFQKSENYNGKSGSNHNSNSSNTKSDFSDEIKAIKIVKHNNGGNHINSGSSDEKNNDIKKIELMGQLWLRNEVQALESKVTKPHNLLLTPYLVLDAKCLTQFTPIVKNLVKTKKFVVLIPTIVLSELDDLKKHSEGARNAIRWLEQEFHKGNRHLRAQRDDETLSITSIKINQNKKLDRESATFLNIIQFCNFIVKNHSSNDVLTLLTGENIGDKSNYHFTFVQLIDLISIKHEIISTFYAKYKKK